MSGLVRSAACPAKLRTPREATSLRAHHARSAIVDRLRQDFVEKHVALAHLDDLYKRLGLLSKHWYRQRGMIVVEAPDQEAGGEVVRGRSLRYLGSGFAMLRHRGLLARRWMQAVSGPLWFWSCAVM
jgi:hypothetical protein